MTFTWNVLDWSGGEFLAFYVLALMASGALGFVLRPWARGVRRPPQIEGLTPSEVTFLDGGPTRACDTLVLELASRDDAKIASDEIQIIRGARFITPGRYRRGEILRAFKASTAAAMLENGLIRRDLVMSREHRLRAFLVVALPAMLLVGLGGAKILIGLARNKPVGFLFLLLLATVTFLAWLWKSDRSLTAEGREALETLRGRHGRAIRAPRASEIPLAFAFAGTAALAGSTYASYAGMVQPASTRTGGADSGSSGCGGGGGGGGCGGCSS